MSLILDALRKSEHDRHGAADSVLPLIVTPRSGGRSKQRRALLPLVIMLLAVVVLTAVLLFRERIFPVATEPRAPALATPLSQQQPQPAPSPPPGEGRAAQVEEPRPVEPSPPAAATVTPPAAAATAPSRAEIPAPPVVQEVKAPAAAAAAARRAPLPRPAVPQPSTPAAPDLETTPAALSTFPADFIRQVQPLHLDFHVYSADPGRRMVYINNREYEEGDQLKSGLRILRIVREGAVMQWRQQLFLLTARD